MKLFLPMILIMARKWRNGAIKKNSVVLALHNLLAGRWKGDKVFVVSDDVAGVDNYNKTLTDIREKLGVRDVYGYAYEHCKRLQPEDVGHRGSWPALYIQSCAQDFHRLGNIAWRYTDWIEPLPLLIAIGHDGRAAETSISGMMKI